MHWRFDPIFSIKIYHAKYKTEDPDTKENPPTARDFSLEPTPSTTRQLKKLGWIFKSQPGSCKVFGEKVFDPERNAVLRTIPAKTEGFTFFLRLNNPALLNGTKPYVLQSKPQLIPNPNLPVYSGRSRLLYFDNLNPVPQSGGEFSLCSGAVDVAQFASFAPTSFTFDKPKNGVKTLKFKALSRDPTTTTFSVNEQSKSVLVKLPENAYTLEQNPGGFSETLFLTSETITGNALGIVRIFGTEEGNWEPIRRYRINFDEA